MSTKQKRDNRGQFASEAEEHEFMNAAMLEMAGQKKRTMPKIADNENKEMNEILFSKLGCKGDEE